MKALLTAKLMCFQRNRKGLLTGVTQCRHSPELSINSVHLR